MATRSTNYNVGNIPPFVKWTLVRGDTAAFKVYLVDDSFQPVNIPDWTIKMEIKRPDDPRNAGVLTDSSTLITTLYPAADVDDEAGEFTVNISSADSSILQSGDIFDIELSLPQNAKVWTVTQGYIELIEDVTN